MESDSVKQYQVSSSVIPAEPGSHVVITWQKKGVPSYIYKEAFTLIAFLVTVDAEAVVSRGEYAAQHHLNLLFYNARERSPRTIEDLRTDCGYDSYISWAVYGPGEEVPEDD